MKMEYESEDIEEVFDPNIEQEEAAANNKLNDNDNDDDKDSSDDVELNENQ